MRVLLVLAVTATALVGCGKKTAKSTAPDSPPPPPPPPHVSSFGNTPTAPNQAGDLTVSGGQGAVQAPRMAMAREVNQAQLKDLHLSMFQAWTSDGRLPSADEVMKEARQNPQLMPLLKEEVVILTGTARSDGVWAYTQYPQKMGEHYVVTQQGVGQMSPEELRKRLEQQQSPVKLGK